jgi:hypothetical protein
MSSFFFILIFAAVVQVEIVQLQSRESLCWSPCISEIRSMLLEEYLVRTATSFPPIARLNDSATKPI